MFAAMIRDAVVAVGVAAGETSLAAGVQGEEGGGGEIGRFRGEEE